MTTQAAFDAGASRYDLLVGLNPGYHRELRRAADALVERTGHDRPLRLVDLACGTGASTRALVGATNADAEILGLDASPGMLAQASAKRWRPGVRFERAVAGELDASTLTSNHDGILAAYLYRNVPEQTRDKALSEAFTLLRPGGWLVAVEYSIAGNRSAQRRWDTVSHSVIIPLGILLDRNASLYRYLWRSVHDFDSVDAFADRLVAAGFTGVAHRTAGGWQHGILHTFVAQRPQED